MTETLVRGQRRSHPTRKEQPPLQSTPRCRICSGVAYDPGHSIPTARSQFRHNARKRCAMIHLAASDLLRFLATYGYWAVLLFVAIESTGIPFRGEPMLLVAAIFAGTTHRLSIPLVIVAAASGAILGDNLGFWVGREGGYRLLRRYGHYIRLEERRLKLGQDLFLKHGGNVVFFGRFVAVLRAWAAFLAGTNRMRWPRFLLFNATGGIVWATLYGLGGDFLGDNIHRLTGPIGPITLLLAVLLMLPGIVIMRSH